MDNFGYVGHALIGETFDLKLSEFTAGDGKKIKQLSFKVAVHTPKFNKKTNTEEVITVNKTVNVFGKLSEQINGYGNGAFVAVCDLEYTPYNYSPGDGNVRGVESFKAKRAILIHKRVEVSQDNKPNESNGNNEVTGDIDHEEGGTPF